jgi:hypothetical protein
MTGVVSMYYHNPSLTYIDAVSNIFRSFTVASSGLLPYFNISRKIENTRLSNYIWRLNDFSI